MTSLRLREMTAAGDRKQIKKSQERLRLYEREIFKHLQRIDQVSEEFSVSNVAGWKLEFELRKIMSDAGRRVLETFKGPVLDLKFKMHELD